MASNRRFYTEKLIKPCPPTNTECQCSEICTPEGQYQLVHESFLDTIAPQFSSGTHVSLFCPKSQRIIQSYSPACSIRFNSNEELNNNEFNEIPTLNLPDHGWHLSKSKNNAELSPTLIPLHPSISDPNHLQTNMTPNRSPSIEKDGFLFTTNTIEKNSSVGSFSSFFNNSNPPIQKKNSTSSHKRKHPKTSFNKLKSSFIDYMTTNDEYTKVMADTSVLTSCSMFNVGVNFCIVDDKSKSKDPLIRLTFSKAYPTCHDINLATSNTEYLDIIIGFNTGDFIWFDPISNRYSRINKNGMMNNSSVTMVKWIPDSGDLFMAAFDDGSILILDKERDDQTFHAKEPQSWAEEHFQVTRPSKYHKHNPVAHWRVSQQGVTAFAFSPDKEYVATVGKDGLLRTVEYQTERLCDVFVGYYGRLLCVAWSPDGQYILTGGQDDLVTIWSFKESRIIARCQGHRSWVTGVAFDPLHCSGNEYYRFASVGEDCKLLLWDFSVNALHKPKQKTRKFSIVAPLPTADSTMLSKDALLSRQNQQQKNPHSMFNANFKRRFKKRTSIFTSNSSEENSNSSEAFLEPSEATQHIQLPTIHPALSKCQVPFLRPIVKQTIHPDPCVDVMYKDDCIVTTDRRGRVRAWARPQQ